MAGGPRLDGIKALRLVNQGTMLGKFAQVWDVMPRTVFGRGQPLARELHDMPIRTNFRMVPFELAKSEACELRLAAFQEACREEITELLGGATHTFVWRNTSDDLGERAWRGKCLITIEPGTWPISVNGSYPSLYLPHQLTPDLEDDVC